MTISILHLLAHLVAYIIMILFTVASILGTIFLWYTYFDIKYDLDRKDKNILLIESIRNETAFLWYSIIATVITVSKSKHTFTRNIIIKNIAGHNLDNCDCNEETGQFSS